MPDRPRKSRSATKKRPSPRKRRRVARLPPTDAQLRAWHEQARNLAQWLGSPEWEETAERAVYLLELRYLHGHLPRSIKPWLRKVILSLLIKRKARAGGLSFEDPGLMDQRSATLPDPDPARWMSQADTWAALRPVIESRLTRRQRAVFLQLPHAVTMRELARLAGVTPRDARNILREIVAKARRFLAHPPNSG